MATDRKGPSKQVNFRPEWSLYDKLTIAAKKDGRTVAGYCLNVVRQHMNGKK